jgi:hypothetical protein
MTDECAGKCYHVYFDNFTSVTLMKLPIEKKICVCVTACLGRKDQPSILKNPKTLKLECGTSRLAFYYFGLFYFYLHLFYVDNLYHDDVIAFKS